MAANSAPPNPAHQARLPTPPHVITPGGPKAATPVDESVCPELPLSSEIGHSTPHYTPHPHTPTPNYPTNNGPPTLPPKHHTPTPTHLNYPTYQKKMNKTRKRKETKNRKRKRTEKQKLKNKAIQDVQL